MMQKSDIKTEKATLGDICAIASLERECFSSPWSEKAILETMQGETSVFLIAKVDGEVCGYIGSYYVMDEGYITNVAVSQTYRRRGLGRALVGALIEKAHEKSLSFLTLEVRASNAAARSLYSSLGFVKVGERPRFYSNPTESAILMTYYTGKEN